MTFQFGKRTMSKFILVCGGRGFLDYTLLNTTMCNLKYEFEDIAVMHGDARGADFLVKAWCFCNGIREYSRPANWELYGKSAGVIRNTEMLNENPDLVVAFEGGRGTRNMVQQTFRKGTEYRLINWEYKPQL